MSINRDNYEIWFLDYAEGSLSDAQVEMLLSFVEQHPDLKEELEAFELVTLPADDVVPFEGKEVLHSLPTTITLTNYEEFFIGWVENTLTAEQQAAVRNFLTEYPHLETEFRTYRKTRLSAEAVVFEPKATLHKSEDAFRITEENQEELFIAAHEGDLNADERKELELWMQDKPEAKASYKGYEKVYLEAPAISFPDKAKLKRRKPVVIPLWTYASVAAAVILLLVWNGLTGTNTDPQTIPGISHANQKTEHPTQVEVRPEWSVPVEDSNPGVLVENEAPAPIPEDGQENPGPGIELGPDPVMVAQEDSGKTSTPITPDITPDPKEDEGIAQENETPDTEPDHDPMPDIEPEEDEGIASTEEFLSPTQLARKTVQDRFFEGKENIGVLDVAAALTANENDQIAVHNHSNNDRTNFSIKVGKFGFSHSKRKKRG